MGRLVFPLAAGRRMDGRTAVAAHVGAAAAAQESRAEKPYYT